MSQHDFMFLKEHPAISHRKGLIWQEIGFGWTSSDKRKGPWLLFVSESGYGKRVPLSSFKLSALNRIGLIGYKFSAEDRLAAVFVVGLSLAEDGESDEQVFMVSQSGTVNRIKVMDISVQSRFARGVILMRLEDAGKIQSASLISVADPEPVESVLELVPVASLPEQVIEVEKPSNDFRGIIAKFWDRLMNLRPFSDAS